MPRQQNLKNPRDNTPNEATAITASVAPPNYASTDRPSKEADSNGSNPQPEKHWLSEFWAVELENKGSTARDHLALERTFLAWLRTSLAFASIGVGISQLFRLNATIRPTDPPQGYATLRHMGKPLGVTFLVTAIVILLIGVQRYFETQGWLLKGKFPASRGGIYLLTGIVAVLIVTTLSVILVVQPSHLVK